MGAIAVQLKPHQGRAAPGDWLDAALAPWTETFATAPGGSLLSITLDLPDALFDQGRDGRADRLWIAPNDTLLGVGAVAGFGDIGAERWRAASRRWLRLGEPSRAPIAFLTAPPAPLGGAARLSLPEVLLRRREGRCSLTLTGFRDSRPAAALARQWGERFCALTAPASQAAQSGVERQEDAPDRDEWRARVRAATQAIAAGRFAKVVLARKLAVTMRKPIDADFLAREMAQASPDCRIIKLPDEIGCVIAASPELLAVKRGANIVSHALAGTSARFRPPDEDAGPRRACLLRPRSASNMRWWSIQLPATCAKSATRSTMRRRPR